MWIRQLLPRQGFGQSFGVNAYCDRHSIGSHPSFCNEVRNVKSNLDWIQVWRGRTESLWSGVKEGCNSLDLLPNREVFSRDISRQVITVHSHLPRCFRGDQTCEHQVVLKVCRQVWQGSLSV